MKLRRDIATEASRAGLLLRRGATTVLVNMKQVDVNRPAGSRFPSRVLYE